VSYNVGRFGRCFDKLFWKQPARRAEDDAVSIAKTLAENSEDEGLKEGFLDLVIQL
jgi:hypothetical protein